MLRDNLLKTWNIIGNIYFDINTFTDFLWPGDVVHTSSYQTRKQSADLYGQWPPLSRLTIVTTLKYIITCISVRLIIFVRNKRFQWYFTSRSLI